MMASNGAISIHYNDLWVIDFAKIRNINLGFSFTVIYFCL